MVKITIENNGKTHADEGDMLLAFVLKEDKATGDGDVITPVSSYLCGKGGSMKTLTNVSIHLGVMVNTLFEDQASRAVAYARMLRGLRRGFEGEGVTVGDESEMPCGCDSCPMEDEEDKEDGKEAD